MLLIAPQVIGDQLWPTLCGGNKETIIHSQKNIFGFQRKKKKKKKKNFTYLNELARLLQTLSQYSKSHFDFQKKKKKISL
jgi:hypothetical protein